MLNAVERKDGDRLRKIVPVTMVILARLDLYDCLQTVAEGDDIDRRRQRRAGQRQPAAKKMDSQPFCPI